MIAKNPLISNGLHISDTDCDCKMVLATAQLRNAVSSPLPFSFLLPLSRGLSPSLGVVNGNYWAISPMRLRLPVADEDVLS